MGLAIVRGFVEANGGRVWVESLPGQGSSFVVELPLEPA
ncbi:MAG: ATP-binding protein [Solirubrobacteraceae bacterium]